ncbi:MAG: glycosyltransferase family 39 protein [Deltaproteobacteria bacterium]|nr:glycosyltransferase family 39 protein [Deltaproteobacteria bacterium]
MFINNAKISEERSGNIIYWVFLGIIIILVVCIRARLLDIPLERDEGEFAYCGQMLLQMVPPFKAVYTMKLPGTCFAYSLIMLFLGQTIKGIHLGLLIVNCLSITLLFLITKKLWNPRAAIIAALSYAFLSVGPTVLGFAAHASHFIVLATLAGTWILLFGLENGRLALYWVSGFLFGLAILMKQQGIFFVLFGGYLILHAGLVSQPARIKAIVGRLLIFGAGAIMPLLLVVAIALISGTFDKFWFWTFKYSAAYAGAVPLSRGMEEFNQSLIEVINSFALLWIMMAFGFLILIIDKRLRGIRWIVLSFSMLSFLSVCAGFYFRSHYFILLFPAGAILIGVFIDSLQYYISQKCSYRIIISLPLLGLFFGIVLGVNAHRDYFLSEKPETLVKTIYGPNPFLESLKIAEFLTSRTGAGDKIAVLGSEPQIFFYAQRKSATGYIYTYELTGNHDYSLSMQKEMIAEIERASPKFLIFIGIIYSWLIQPDSKTLILNWFQDYSQKYYHLVGRVDIVSARETRYFWGGEAGTGKPESPFSILIYERRQAPD